MHYYLYMCSIFNVNIYITIVIGTRAQKIFINNNVFYCYYYLKSVFKIIIHLL